MADEELLRRRPWLKQYDWSVPWTINYPRFPAWELLRNAASQEPDKAATWFYGTTLSFLELYTTSIRLSNKLIELGVKKGDRIGIMLPDSPQFNIAYWAALAAGAVVVNLNPLYTLEELTHYSKDTGMTGLFTFDTVLPKVKPLCQTLNIPLVIVTRLTDFVNGKGVSTPDELGLQQGWHHLTRLLEQSTNASPPRPLLKPDDPAVIQFTGGTTGVSKGAVLTQANMVAAAMLVTVWGASKLDDTPIEKRKALCVLPYFHVYGQVCCIIYCVKSYATQIILPSFNVDEVIDTMKLFWDISYWPCVPTMLQAVLNSPRVGEVQLLKRIGFVCTGAAPCPLELIEQALKIDVYYSEGWGMSENAALGVSNPVQGAKKPLSIGIPMPDNDIRLVDPNTLLDVPRGERGEIWIKGPTVMKEYWNNPEETAATFVDGWMRTGDVAYMDEDNYVFIVDRTKDLIIAGGYNIYPRDIDEVLYRHPKVKDVICVGIPDKYYGEIIKAYIQLVEGQTATEEELKAYCKEHLAPYKIPRKFEFHDELPRTTTGKALRRMLRDQEIAKMAAAAQGE